jgi:hypothetical protein
MGVVEATFSREDAVRELFELGVLSAEEVRAELGHEPEPRTHRSWAIVRNAATGNRAGEPTRPTDR